MAVEHLNDVTYLAFVGSTDVLVVHFWAEWDRTHIWMRRQIEEAIASTSSPIRHAMVDTDSTGDLCQGLGIATVPTVIYYRNGERVTTRIGNNRASTIAEDLLLVRSSTDLPPNLRPISQPK